MFSAILLAALALAGSPAGAQPISLTDDAGRHVRLPAPARRAVTLTPHATELAYAAGAGSYLVGSTRGSNYPPAARALPSVGDAFQPDLERLLGLRPDLLIAWQPSAAGSLAGLPAKWGIPVYYSDPRKLDDIPSAIEHFGTLFGTESIARAEAGRLRDRLQQLRQRYAHKTPVRVFVQAGVRPLYTINDNSIIGDALRLCGAVNVFGASQLLAPQVSIEGVLAAAPEAVIAGVDSARQAQALQQDWRATGLPSARAGHIYALDADTLYRPGPRLIESTATLCEQIDRARR
ncbi:cobalamin-binding protein [Bordetella holmesii]|uniref:Oligopeptide ABC transporter, oligopeptide-binding protein n=2 Tax=Bordetella holmesii TaxID=35814 RepID=A0A158M9C1_9BORD|nr:cobalamin-binding protein [Bordetella holmesii]AIT26549.1 periplasmic binding family protein [Bordetella holmesii 44057]EWM41660.1 periplasmic binding family protein [Bordetella holmesii 41130]EWM47127.1 periplasmic binding family protein [Bordetella holmesii 35009]EWM51291.1 periplasmic binding family protein [Bordetella holmesii 70147]KAK84339.1 oligopeptide ABC transporter, oligopeptide-binding protein [Bordetella holmesii H620]KCV16628.1 oligopeptide ABC transporter, oligopeptide-bindi